MSAKRGCLSLRKHILSVRFDTRRKLLNANGNANGSLYGIRPNFLLQARWICTAQRHSVLLFPGQGAQYVGMCGRLLYNPRVAELFERAQRILGYDILQVCISGTANELNKTEFCQPAVMLSSLAALECLADTRPEFSLFDHRGPSPSFTATAGFSVGEFAALVFGRAMSLDDALDVVQLRALAMQRASEEFPSGMITVTGLEEEQVTQLCNSAKRQTNNPSLGSQSIAIIASYLFPKGYVIAGSEEVIQFIERHAMTKQYGAKRVQRLPVSGAFHSPIMGPAQPALKDALDKVKIRLPQLPVYSNVTAQPYKNPEEIRRLLVQQLVEPVRWNQIVLNMFADKNTVTTYEVGPQRQLKSMMFQINRRLLKNFTSVEA